MLIKRRRTALVLKKVRKVGTKMENRRLKHSSCKMYMTALCEENMELFCTQIQFKHCCEVV